MINGVEVRFDFVQKNFGSSIKYENVIFLGVFRHLLGNYSKEFGQTWSKGSPHRARAFTKTFFDLTASICEIMTF